MKKTTFFLVFLQIAFRALSQSTLESSAYPGLRLTNDNAQIRLYGEGLEKWTIGSTGGAGNDLIFYDITNGTVRFILDENNGNIGLGTYNPKAKLQISSNWDAITLGRGTAGRADRSWIGFNTYADNTKWYTFNTSYDGLFYYGYPSSNDNVTMHVFGFVDKTSQTESIKMVITKAGKVGINTTSPNGKLEIYNENIFDNTDNNFEGDNIIFKAPSPNPGNGSYFGGLTWNSNGRRRASIVAVKDHDDSDHVGIAFFTKGTDGAGPMYESMRISRNGNVGIGTTTPTSLLSVAGKMDAREVEVSTTAGADFVFDENYPIKNIEEVEAYVKENKHLPEIPSANEMIENGINLGEMNIKLLQKIEELTLYLIEQNKKIKVLEEERLEKIEDEAKIKVEIQKLKEENVELKKLNNKLLELEEKIEKLTTNK